MGRAFGPRGWGGQAGPSPGSATVFCPSVSLALQHGYPVSRGFSFAWLLAFTMSLVSLVCCVCSWFVYTPFMSYLPTEFISCQDLEDFLSCMK